MDEIDLICKTEAVAGQDATYNLPEQSKRKYEQAYANFMVWRQAKNMNLFSEDVLFEYFNELSTKYKAASLWTFYSMLRSTLNINHGIQIDTYLKLRAFLKQKSEGVEVKKTKTFTTEEINKFLNDAPDNIYLATKVALIMGIMGACRAQELHSMSLEDVEDLGSVMLVTIPKTKSKVIRKFTVTGNFYKICRKYTNLRPPEVTSTSFFLSYYKGKCNSQRIGINKFGGMGQQVAKFLNLPDSKLYTGHCFRRSSATILVDAQGDITTLKETATRISAAINTSDVNTTNSSNEALNELSAKTLSCRTLCERHFKDSDFSNAERSRLHPTAVPANYADNRMELIESMFDANQGMEDTCRVCLIRLVPEKSSSIFVNNLQDVVSTISNVKITQDDELPTKVCERCSNQLEQVLKLKTQIETSDNILRKRLGYTNVHIKEEINTIESDQDETVYVKGEPTSPSMQLENEDIDEESMDTDHDTNTSIQDNNTPADTSESVILKFEEEEEDIQLAQNDDKVFMVTEEDMHTGEDSNTNTEIVNDNECNESSLEAVLEEHSSVEDDDDDDEKLKNLDCAVCRETFPEFKLLKAHLKIHDGNFPCYICTEEFRINSRLVKHLRLHGIGEKKYACKQCPKKYYTSDALRAHKKKHTGVREFVCDGCDKSFYEKSSLTKHKVLHTGIKKFECDICQMKFMHANALRVHIRRHNGERRWKCSLCTFSSVTKPQLTQHMRKHTNERPYACDFCGDKFTSRGVMLIHRQKHTGEYRYNCEHCGKGLATSGNYKRHMRTHSKYVCSFESCGDTFDKESSYQAHLKVHEAVKQEEEEAFISQHPENYVEELSD